MTPARLGLASAVGTLVLLAGALPAAASDPNPVDTGSRAAVRQAYVDRWLPATTTPITPSGGSVGGCTPSTTSPAQQSATASAINFARGLVGEAAVRFEPAYDLRAARAALIMAANKSLSHDPPPTWDCWTQSGHDAAGRSNLQLSSGTVTAARVAELYLDDPGAGNTAAGHRRWLLRPEATTMGSGNARGDWFANDLYVFTFANDDARAPAQPYYAWPSAGWFPSPLEPAGRWSLSSSGGARFSDATVSVTGPGGANVPLTRRPVADGYADNTLVWDLTTPPPAVSGSADASYRVTVTGITGGPSSTYSYPVRLFDPSVALADPAPVPARVRTSTGLRLSTSTARRNRTRVRVTVLTTAADGSEPTGTLALVIDGHRLGLYPLGAGDAASAVVTLPVFRKAGAHQVYAALKESATYARSQSRTRTITVR